MALAGCLYLEEEEGGEVQLYAATLRELPGLEVVIEVKPTSVRAELTYANGYEHCAVLEKPLRASVGGIPMTTTRGDGDYDLGCTAPTASLVTTEPLVDAMLVIEDDSLSITTDLSQEVVERRVELVSHSSWTFARGSEVTYRWSPGFDFDGDDESWVMLVPDPSTLRTVTSTETGDLVTFTVPTDAAPGVAAALWLSFRGPVSSDDPPPCTGAACRIQYDHTVEQPIIIE